MGTIKSARSNIYFEARVDSELQTLTAEWDHSLKGVSKTVSISRQSAKFLENRLAREGRLYARAVARFSPDETGREFFGFLLLFFTRQGGGERLSRNRNARRVARDSGITPRRARDRSRAWLAR